MKAIRLKLFAWACVCLLALPAGAQSPSVGGAASASAQKKAAPVDKLIRHLQNPRDPYVLVASHRGDWRSFPENTLEAIESAIALGVDIVEIDLQKTSDGQLILMHDKTVDRTTTGTGPVSSYTLDSLKKLRLKNAIGRSTMYTVPTLEEVMRLARDRVLINIDKGYDYFDQVYEILKRTGTMHQVIIKSDKSAAKVKKDFGPRIHEVMYMPIIFLEKKEPAVKIEQNSALRPLAMEIVFEADTSSVLPRLKELPWSGSRVWVNAMWGSLDGGRSDDEAVTNPNANWGWLLGLGGSIIQTDRPQLLIDYLKKKGLRR